jgi:mono/diheme cytochrome c family protein
MKRLLVALVLVLPGPVLTEARQESVSFGETIRPILTKNCIECHGPEKPKGDLRLDTLAPDFTVEAARESWRKVQEQLRSGTMPPKKKPRLAPKDLETLTAWVGAGLDSAEGARRAREGRVVVRRLNRNEYQNTIRDLLGVEIDLVDLLPLDTSSHGFDNLGEAMHISSFLMERYLEAADKALGVAIVNAPQPPFQKKRYFLKDAMSVKVATEKVYRPIEEDALVLFSSSNWNSIVLSQFYPPDRGRYRFRMCASGFQSAGKPVVYRIDAGPMLMGTKSHLVSYFDAAADQPTVMEWTDHFEARNHIRISPYGLATAHVVNKIGAADYTGPGLAVQWVEVEGPIYEQWPPASHRRIFGDLPQKADKDRRLEVVSEHPEADAERIFRDFTPRAFRRAVSEQEIRPFIDLVLAKMREGRTFEQAVRVGLSAVLVSPEFLFLKEKPGRLEDFALASRLSYFLWSSMPDAELTALAGKGELSKPETLRAQVERMLKDPKASAFTENFVGQWLALRDIDFTEPSMILYPEFDDMLKVSMVKEAQLFFEELLKNDLSIANVVSSDFAMLNGRLARHYGIPDVEGWSFRKVALPPGSHRGGVLTMAGVLKVTANGTQTSPVLRGAWVLDRILGTPPPRPPAGVPSVEPDIRGATTIRSQLAKHRQLETCATCHVKIDPPGFALESFDVIGGWRENYRTTGRGQEIKIDGRRMPYLKGPKVDAADVTPDGAKFETIDEFKALLLRDKDQIAKALAARLVTYATGGAPASADQPEIDAIVGKIRGKDYGLRTLVHEVVQSGLFRTK